MVGPPILGARDVLPELPKRKGARLVLKKKLLGAFVGGGLGGRLGPPLGVRNSLGILVGPAPPFRLLLTRGSFRFGGNFFLFEGGRCDGGGGGGGILLCFLLCFLIVESFGFSFVFSVIFSFSFLRGLFVSKW